MMRVLLPLLLAVGVACAATAQVAGEPAAPGAQAGPYSATVAVAGTSDEQRTAAISNALAQVLEQVSPGFAASPDMLANASGYVRNYHYRRAAGGGLELQVDFDPGAVSRLVAQSGGAAAGSGGEPGTASSSAAVAQGGTGTIWVGGLDNSHAFAALLSLLRGDPALHDVVPVATRGDGVLVQLGYDQPLDGVIADLTGPGGHLAEDPQPHPGADAALRWVP